MYYKIKSFCDEKQIPIMQMCNDLEISPQIITNLKNRTESNENAGLSAENTAKIADYMGISVSELIRRES